MFSIEDRSVQYALLGCGYVDAIASHETTILQYMKDNSVAFRILSEPLLVTGLGVAFATNDSRGLDSQLNDTFAQLREGRHAGADRRQISRKPFAVSGGGRHWNIKISPLRLRGSGRSI